MRKKNCRQTTIYLDTITLDIYQRKYPYTLSDFLRNCIKIAVENEDFIYRVWTYDNKKK